MGCIGSLDDMSVLRGRIGFWIPRQLDTEKPWNKWKPIANQYRKTHIWRLHKDLQSDEDMIKYLWPSAKASKTDCKWRKLPIWRNWKPKITLARDDEKCWAILRIWSGFQSDLPPKHLYLGNMMINSDKPTPNVGRFQIYTQIIGNVSLGCRWNRSYPKCKILLQPNAF